MYINRRVASTRDCARQSGWNRAKPTANFFRFFVDVDGNTVSMKLSCQTVPGDWATPELEAGHFHAH